MKKKILLKRTVQNFLEEYRKDRISIDDIDGHVIEILNKARILEENITDRKNYPSELFSIAMNIKHDLTEIVKDFIINIQRLNTLLKLEKQLTIAVSKSAIEIRTYINSFEKDLKSLQYAYLDLNEMKEAA